MPYGLRRVFALLCLCLFFVKGALAQHAPTIQWERGTGFPYQICATADPFVVSLNSYNSVLVFRQSDMSIAHSYVVPAEYGTAFAMDTVGAAGKTLVAIGTTSYLLVYDLATWTLKVKVAMSVGNSEGYMTPVHFSATGNYVSAITIVSGGVETAIVNSTTGLVTATLPGFIASWAPSGDTILLFLIDPTLRIFVTQAYTAQGASLGPSQDYWSPANVGEGTTFGALPNLQPVFAGFFESGNYFAFGLMFTTLADASKPGVDGFFAAHPATSHIAYYNVVTHPTSSGYLAFAIGKDNGQDKVLTDVFGPSGYLYSIEPNAVPDSYNYSGFTVPTADNTGIVASTMRAGTNPSGDGSIDTSVYNQAGVATAVAGGHTEWVTNTAWSPNGALLATAGSDGYVTIWDAVKGVQLGYLVPFNLQGTFGSLQFASSGTAVLVADGTGNVDLIDVSNPSHPTVKLSIANAGTYAQISGSNIYTSSPDTASFSVYSASDGSLIRTVDVFTGGGQFALTANGADLVTFQGVYSATTGAAITVFANVGYDTVFAALSADGSMAAVEPYNSDASITVFSTQSGKVIRTLGAALPWRSVSFSPDGKYLYASDYQDGEIYVFNIATGAQVTAYNVETFAGGSDGGANGSFGISFRPDGVELAYGRGDAVTVAALNSYYTGPTISSVSVPASVLGGLSANGTVTLTSAAPSTGLLVTLNSSSAVATVPSYVVVPAGQTTATFTIATTPVNANTTVTISGTVGTTTKSAPLVVESVMVTGLTLAPTVVVGGASATGTVTVSNPAPPGGVTISLSSSASAASVPSTVTVPGGATTATFTVTTVPVAANTTASITATFGTSQKSASLTIDAPTLSSVACSPTTVAGGVSSTGTVTIGSPAPAAGLQIALTSNETYATVPSTVTVASGQTTATFLISTTPVSSNGEATISAAFGGVTKTCQLTVDAPTIKGLALNPTTVSGGSNSTGTITLSSPAPSAGLSIALTSGAACAVVPTNVTVAGAGTSATFAITTTPVASNTTVPISATLNGTTTTAALTVDAPALVSVTLSPTTVTGGDDSMGTVTLASPAPTGGMKISIASNTADATVPSSVVVTAGAKTASFTAVTLPVAVNVAATISATSNGVTKTATLTIQANPIASFTVSPTSVVGGSTTTVTGSIALTYPVAQNTTIALASSNSSAASVPASVTILAGQKTGTFPVSHFAVASPQTVTFTASPPSGTATTNLTVNPNPIVSLALNPSSVVGGSNTVVTGTVTLLAPVAVATTVSLLSLDPLVASVPATLSIPAGKSSATFTVTTYPVTFVAYVAIAADQDDFFQAAILTLLP